MIKTHLHSRYRTIWAAHRLIGGVAMLATLACGGGGDKGGVTGPEPVVTTTFTLQQVNGQNLPASFQTSDGKLLIGSGTMILKPEKTFSETIAYTLTPPTGAAVADTSLTTGTYAVTGNDIVFTIPATATDPASTFSGTLTDNSLSYNDAGFVAVYRR